LGLQDEIKRHDWHTKKIILKYDNEPLVDDV
jgi:hypothetical protein